MQRGSAINRLVDRWLGVPALNLLAGVRRRGICPKHPRRIGLLFNPALGDTLLASAATQEIRAIFPAAKLILFAASTNVAAARLLPDVDAIKVLPIARPVQSIRMIRHCKLDMMLDFTAWQRITALYTLLSGAKFTVGFERKDQYRHRGYDKTVPHRGDCHELENLRQLTRALGSKTSPTPRLLVPTGPLPKTLLQGGRMVVFHAWASGSHSRLREWPDESWAGLARQLMAPGRVFLLTGSPDDKPRCDALCRRLGAQGTPAEILIGRTGIAEVARVLTHAELLVSVNTGIMHLGAILGCPTVSLNGPTAVHRWGPVGPRVVNVCPSDGSGGFLDLGFEYRRRSTDVMSKIGVGDVVDAIHRLCGTRNEAGFYADRQREFQAHVSRPATVHQRQERVSNLQLGGQPAESL